MLSFHLAATVAISFILITYVQSTSDPTQNPTQSPTSCDADYAILKDFYDNEEFNSTNKNIDSIILYAGESIISQNCLYLLQLTKNGSLIFKNTITGQVLWQTNSSLYNRSSTDIEKENLLFFLSNDELFIIQDNNPTDPLSEPHILWVQDIDQPATNNDADYRIIVNNDGYFIIVTNDIFDYEEIYRRPLPEFSTTIYYSTSVYTSDDDSGDGKDNDDDKDGLSHLDWLWILFALLVLFCLGYLLYIRYCYKKYKVKHDIDLMVTTATVTKQEIDHEVAIEEAEEEEDIKDDGQKYEDEDAQINKWMSTDHQATYTEIDGGIVKGNIEMQEN